MTPTLAQLPDRGADADAILDRFVNYAAQSGLSLYPAQEEAILELLSGKHLILNTPTGSGKSLVATALHFKAMAEGKVSVYTCPIKALVNEKFFALCQAFGPEAVGMLTGDASINRGAPILCCTAEILANLCLREADPRVDYVVMDEFHYYSDKERGVAWQIPLISLPRATFLLMSATLGDLREVEESLRQLTGKEVAVVRSSTRPVPLDFEYRETALHETIEALIAAKKYPIYLVNFTQRACAEEAQNLMSVDFSSKEEKEQLKVALADVAFDTPYGKEFQRFLRHGVGLHHAGLLPKYRLLVEKLAQAGALKVVSGTDTLGVGVNIPIRTVLFTQLCKYDGQKVGVLSVRDFLQIAGRAGRKGFDEHGSVVVQAPAHAIENLRLAEKRAQGKKVVMQKPPKGYVHWDRATFERLRSQQPEPLEPRFEVQHGLLLSLLQGQAVDRHGGYGRLIGLIGRSHGSERARRLHRRSAAERFRTLRAAGIIDVVARPSGRGRQVVVSEGLERDFSLNHTLSLFLLDIVGRLDPNSESYALDVLSLVESILENPDVILYKQLDKLKTAKLDELKAQGVEYAERMEELDKLEWPKPNREFIYQNFNAFAAKHPWVGEENIRPKSIARELFEIYSTFNDYVREYGLQRSEGVLLRYLSDVYKTLQQNVPDFFRNEEIEDILVHLRTTLRAADSSLLEEWERLRDGKKPSSSAAASEEASSAKAQRSLDDKSLRARVRAELHRLLRSLAARNYDEAARAIFQPQGEWPPERLASELAPYWAEHATIVVTPDARRPDRTHLRQIDAHNWAAQQRIVDGEDDDWMLDCVVDLTELRSEDQPLIELRRIGV